MNLIFCKLEKSQKHGFNFSQAENAQKTWIFKPKKAQKT